MEKRYIIYRDLGEGRLNIGTMPTAKCVTINQTCDISSHYYHLCPITIQDDLFVKTYLNKRSINQQFFSELHHAEDQRQLLSFTCIRFKFHHAVFTHKDYPDFTFILPSNQHPNYHDLYPGCICQLFVTNSDSLLLSYYYPQDRSFTIEFLPISTMPTPMDVIKAFHDRLVVSYNGFNYTIPSEDLFYANTPLGLHFYEQANNRKISLYVIGKNHFTDKQIPYKELSHLDNENAPKVGSIIRGIPYWYNEDIGIFVKINTLTALIPHSSLNSYSWQTIPYHFPLGVEKEFLISSVPTDSNNTYISLSPTVKNDVSEKCSLPLRFLEEGKIYQVKLSRCKKSEKGDLLYLSGFCKTEYCRLYKSAVPTLLHPLLERLVEQKCTLRLCINRTENYYVCSWPSYSSLTVNISKGLYPLRIACIAERLALLTMGDYIAVHQFRVWELWQLKRSKLKVGDIIEMQVLGLRHDGFLDIAINDKDIWEKCIWKVGDSLVPLGRATDNGWLICNCNDVPGILFPLGSPFTMGQDVRVLYVNKAQHILLVTTEPELLTSDNLLSLKGKKVVGKEINYLRESFLTIKVEGTNILVIEDSRASAFLLYFSKHMSLFIDPSPLFILDTIEGTNYIYAKWTGFVGKEDFSELTSENGIRLNLLEKKGGGVWAVTYRQLEGYYYENADEINRDNQEEIVAELNGKLTSDGKLSFVPYKGFSVPVPNVAIGSVIPIHHKANGNWYYNNYEVTFDWGMPIYPNIENSQLAKPLTSLDVEVISNDCFLIVDGKRGLQNRYKETRWNGHGVIADMFVVGKLNNSSIILAGNYGAGILPISELEKDTPPRHLSSICQDGELIPVKIDYQDPSGMTHFITARPLGILDKYEEISATIDDKPTSLAKQYDNGGYIFMRSSWRKYPLEAGDHLFVEIVNINKGLMTVRWQSVCMIIRRRDSVPQLYYWPAELYKVGQMIDCVIDKFNPESGLFYIKVFQSSDGIQERIDFEVGQIVEANVVRADFKDVIVSHNDVRGVIHQNPNNILQVEIGQLLLVKCLSLNHDDYSIEFSCESINIKQGPTNFECIVSKTENRHILIVEYNNKSHTMDTGDIPAYAFVPGDIVLGSINQNSSYTLSLIGFRKSTVLKGELVSGTIIESQSHFLTIELDDGTRGVFYYDKPIKKEKNARRKLRKKYPIGEKVEHAFCIWVNSEMGIARLDLRRHEIQDRYLGLSINNEVAFTIARIDHSALHGYVDNLYAIIKRSEAGWKYGIFEELALKKDFSVGDKLSAHIIAMSGRLELSLKSSEDEYNIALQVGNLVKGKIIRYIPCLEDWHNSYYLLEWDEFVGILPFGESSYQAFMPLCYFPGEEVLAKIIDKRQDDNLPILSYRQCNLNPLRHSSLKVGEDYDAQPLGVSNGCLVVLLPQGIRSCISIKNNIGSRSQYEDIISQPKILVKISGIFNKKYTIELSKPLPMGTTLLRGTKINITIFQIEIIQMDVRGYDAFSDDGLLVWIPQKNNIDRNNTKYDSKNLNIGDRFIARLTSNPGERIIKAVIVERI